MSNTTDIDNHSQLVKLTTPATDTDFFAQWGKTLVNNCEDVKLSEPKRLCFKDIIIRPQRSL